MGNVVLITPEHTALSDLQREICVVESIVNNFDCRVHIRKKGDSRQLVEAFCEQLYQTVDVHRVAIHYYPDIALKYGFNYHGDKQQFPQANSISCHSLDEVELYSNSVEYLFLSPIFNSISKQGYSAAFDIERLSGELKNREWSGADIYALGGIESSNATQALDMGFDGVALLGAVWRDGIEFAENNFKTIYNDIYIKTTIRNTKK